MKRLKSFEKSSLKDADGVFAVLRVFLGGILLWKCAEFYFNRELLLEMIAGTEIDWFFPMAWAHYVILAHFLGALCLFGGLATRFACIVQLPILLGAVFWVHLPAIMQIHQTVSIVEFNLALMTLVMLLFYSFRGAGIYSLDYYTALDEEGEDHHGHHPHGAH